MIALGEQLRAAKPLPLVINGLSGGAVDAFLVETVREACRAGARPAILLVRDDAEANRVATLLADAALTAAAYPARELCFFEMSASHDLERERLSVLHSLLSGELDAVVTTAYAALQPTMPPEELISRAAQPTELSPDGLIRRLLSLGYVRVDAVESAGQFSRHGGIVDLWPAGLEYPVRLDYFGDELDRMTSFDPLTQRTVGECEPFALLPAREVIADGDALARVLATVDRLAARAGDESRRILSGERAAIESGRELPFLDKYIRVVYPEAGCLFSYCSAPSLHLPVLVLGTTEVYEQLKARNALLAETVKPLVEGGLISERLADYTGEQAALDARLADAVPLHVNTFSGGVSGLRMAGLFGFRCRRTVSYAGRLELLCEELKTYISGKYRILILTETAGEAEALVSRLLEHGLSASLLADVAVPDAETLKVGRISIGVGRISSGYELLNARVAILSTASDESREETRRRLRRRSRRVPAGKHLLSYADLSEGDYVVHATHGIGLFEGIETITVDGASRDYITIRYAGVDKLFLPAERLEMISKYIGARAEDGTVKLSRLGGTDWQKQKSRAKAAAKEMAHELITLYAARQRRPGFAFLEDEDLEGRFAEAFPFEETEAQEIAIREIMSDMMRPVPMDRLLCGDVGFGKTEVALRAAFKAIVSGKQAAILVPTTILALQHYQTALSRMRGFPVTVEMLSRFRTPKEQASILRRLRRGEIDLIVGTHKLLGASVEFKDLGLMIVDEEQRFGVSQKEKLKRLASDVDCLTLTATPIPRTLNMAMSGIRDMSILDEAPGDRFPVQTYVFAHDDFAIAEAMRRELARGGQVLYLYNKVEDIDLVAGRVLRALPDARVAYAHGKMDRDELEDIWQALVRGEIDVLVCTTIIETGVDLPNANTLIIENADRLGLAQLHQIRGRVGRSGRHAYAYFTYRPGKSLSEIAEKRLSAIREYAEFGAGFKIALRDLEIRGAGNLLGGEQHGHIDSVGYDLYIRLLNEAVLEEQGRKIEPPFEATVDFKESAHIPVGYVASSAQRMEMYKKISLILGEDDMRDVSGELRDRFGEPPPETVRLLRLALLRALASRARISRIESSTADVGGRDRLATGKSEVRFIGGEMDISVWALVFGEYGSLRFGGLHRAGSSPGVTMRIARGEDAAERALAVMLCYERHRAALAEKKEKS